MDNVKKRSVGILAGGKGSRMDDHRPKAMVEVKGRPIIAHQLDIFLPQVSHIVLSLGHEAEKIVQFVREKYSDYPIDFAIENKPIGTAGGIKKAARLIESEMMYVVNCDDITDISLQALETTANGENTICVAHP